MRSWTAIAPPGLEAVVARELKLFGHDGQIEPGAVRFQASLYDGARLARRLHCPSRVLLEVARGEARSSHALGRLVRGGDWEGVATRYMPFEVTLSTRKSRLNKPRAVEHTVTLAVEHAKRQAGVDAAPGDPVQRVQVRLQNDQATVSVDAGGELLHRRGWRIDPLKAPLRENLGACLLLMGGYDGLEPLLDPFCGAGTLPIEAALWGRSPFVGRRLNCEAWPGLVSPEAPTPTSDATPEAPAGSVFASDKSAVAVATSRAHAAAAGVELHLRQLDVADLTAPAGSGLVVANPPYGLRLGQTVEGVYRAFGRALRAEFTGWRVLFLAPTDRLAVEVHREARLITTFPNGGQPVGAYSLEL